MVLCCGAFYNFPDGEALQSKHSTVYHSQLYHRYNKKDGYRQQNVRQR